MLFAPLLLIAAHGHAHGRPIISPPPLVQMQAPPPVITPTTPETTRFSTVNGWTIGIDNSVGAGCYLYTSYLEGTVLRLGFDQIAGNGYILLGNSAWQSLRQGDAYPLELRFGTGTPWQANASGFRFPTGGLVYLNATFTRPEFLTEFMAGQSLNVTYHGTTVALLRLDDAAGAGQELIRCQQAHPRSDPFRAPTGSNDPFRA